MSDYTEFFLNNVGSVLELETLEIYHPSFSQTYRVVRNASEGITVKYEDLAYYAHTYYPLRIQSLGARGDLDQGFSVIMGDLSDVLPAELDRVTYDDTFSTKPIVKYRTYRSDNLDTILFGPLTLEVTTFSFTRSASTFEAKSPQININKTGELYRIERFPTLRSLL